VINLKIKPNPITTNILCQVVNELPNAYAIIKGENGIEGTVTFYDNAQGTLMLYFIKNLPKAQKCQGGIFGFHIHQGKHCTGTKEEPYANALGHYDPNNCEHPFHLGDLPPLFGFHQKAWALVLIDKFTTKDIIGHTMIIHAHADDFHTQPSGNSGQMIACGEIKKFEE